MTATDWGDAAPWMIGWFVVAFVIFILGLRSETKDNYRMNGSTEVAWDMGWFCAFMAAIWPLWVSGAAVIAPLYFVWLGLKKVLGYIALPAEVRKARKSTGPSSNEEEEE